MKKRLVLKPFVLPTVYTLFALIIITSLFFSANKIEDNDNYTYVSKIILDEYVPVVQVVEESIMKPFVNSEVEIKNNFYNSTNTEDNSNSILFYEGTYIQNTGINYKLDKSFEVVSILSGEVIDIQDKELLGKSISIRHDNNLISVYQCLDNVNVEKGSYVSGSQLIATSGSCDLLAGNDNNLHFELYSNGIVVDPNNYFGKKLSDF